MKPIALYRHIVRYPNRLRRRALIRRMRGHFAFFGHRLPESEFRAYLYMLRGCKAVRKVVARSGITVAQAGESFRQFGEAVRAEFPAAPPLVFPQISSEFPQTAIFEAKKKGPDFSKPLIPFL